MRVPAVRSATRPKPDISDDAGLLVALTEDTSETVERVLD